MLDEERIRLIFQLAEYEQGTGSRDLKIMKYTEKDYAALSLIKNFFLTTVAYVLLLAGIVLCNLRQCLDLLSEMNFIPLLGAVLIGYLFVLAFYSVLVYTISRLRYGRAARRVKNYYRKLKALDQLYRDEKLLAGGLQNDED